VERDFHKDILRIGDPESDVKLRFPALQHFGIGRSSENAPAAEDFVCHFVTRLNADVGQPEVNRFVGLVQTVTVNFR
jgi:hypothetical protein